MPEPFRWRLRVYWEDTDAGGVVFYANHLKFFERARTEWLRSLGHEQEALRRDHGTLFVVSETALRYLRPARLDDLLDVTVEVLESRGASMRLAQQAWRVERSHIDDSQNARSLTPTRSQRESEKTAGFAVANSGEFGIDAGTPVLLAEGTIRIGCVAVGTFAPRRIPKDLLNATR